MNSAGYRVEGDEIGRVQQPQHCPQRLCHQRPLLLPTLVKKGQKPTKLGGNEGPGRHPSPRKVGPKSFPWNSSAKGRQEPSPPPTHAAFPEPSFCAWGFSNAVCAAVNCWYVLLCFPSRF